MTEEVPESFRSLWDAYHKIEADRDRLNARLVWQEVTIDTLKKQRDALIAEVEELKMLNRRMDRELCDCCDGTGFYKMPYSGFITVCPECG